MKQFKRFYALEEIGSPAFTIPYGDVPFMPKTSEEEELIFIPEINKTQLQPQSTIPDIPSVTLPAKSVNQTEYLYQPSKANPIHYIRFFNSAPLAPAVDIYVNKIQIAQNLKYGEFTEYSPFFEESYLIELYKHGENLEPLISVTQNIKTEGISTLALIGTPETLELYAIKDFGQKAAPNDSGIRFIQLLPELGNVDIYIDDTMVIFDMAYKDISNFILLPLEDQSIEIKRTGTDDVIFKLRNFLENGYYYTSYIIGYYESTDLPQMFFKI